MSSHRFDPDHVVPTSEVLREWLDENHLTPEVACASRYAKGEPRTWAANRLRSVLADKALDSRDIAVLAAVTGITASFWRNFEHNYRAGLATGKTVLT